MTEAFYRVVYRVVYKTVYRQLRFCRFLALMKSLDDSVELCTDNWIFRAYENIVRPEWLGDFQESTVRGSSPLKI